MEQTAKHCLICYNNVTLLNPSNNPVSYGDNDNNCSNENTLSKEEVSEYRDGVISSSSAPTVLLKPPSSPAQTNRRDLPKLVDKQLHVIFILRELLKIPVTLIKQYFIISGGENPSCWINICDRCHKNVEAAKKIFEEIVVASRKIKEVQEQVITVVKRSHKINGGGAFRKKDDLGGRRKEQKKDSVKFKDVHEVVTEECRKFVKRHEYGNWYDPFILGDMEAEGALHKLNLPTEMIKEEWDDEMVLGPSSEPQIGGNLNLNDDLGEALPFEMEFSEGDEVADHDPEWEPPPSDDNNDMEENLAKTEENLVNSQTSLNVIPEPSSRSKRLRQRFSRKKNPNRKYKLIDVPGAFRSESGKVNFRCQVEGCSKVLTTKRGYERHKLGHTDIPRESQSHPCLDCGKVYGSVSGLYIHKKAVHEKQPKNYHKRVNQEKLREARKKRLANNKFKCPHCDLETPFKIVLENHIKRKHENEYRIYCEICGKGEISRYDFRRHQADIHSICSLEECKRTFGGREELRNHQVEIHGKEVDVFACDECGKCFMLGKYLTRHKQIHEHQRTVSSGGDAGGGGGSGSGGGTSGEYVCDICGKRYACKDYLYYHNWHTHRKLRKKKKDGRSGVRGDVPEAQGTFELSTSNVNHFPGNF